MDQNVPPVFSAEAFADAALKEQTETLSKMEPVNIVVTGNSGVGKSTLINAIFKKQLAKVAMGAPQTMDIERITDPSLPLTLYDTRGLEVADSADTIAKIKTFIEYLRKRELVSEQIHVVWLCILESSNRVEPVHQQMVSLFAEYQIPCVVVLTQSQGNDEFAETVRNLLPGRPVVPVMAETMKRRNVEFAAEGLDVLVEETLRLLPDAVKRAFDYCQKASWDRKVASARGAIKWAVAAVVAAAAIPLPGGHTAACITIETAMLVRINTVLGIQIKKDELHSVVLGGLGIVMATVGGKMAFAEALKFIPGVGTITGIIVGAGVAGPVCYTLGECYMQVVLDLAKSGQPMPGVAALIDLLRKEYTGKKSHYDDMKSKKVNENGELVDR